MSKPKLLMAGATGFIGRNLLEHFLQKGDYAISAVWHEKKPPQELKSRKDLQWIQADLRNPEDTDRAVKGQNILIQAAATTSGARDIVNTPFIHVTDNAVMNSHLFRSCYEQKLKHVLFFSCTVMYPSQRAPVREEDFKGEISEKYFGAGWTKVYVEKLCEFYGRLGPTKYTAVRHSNIYGPHDKYDLERSHVFGATVAKVMKAKDNVRVWGKGTEARDLLHVDDLVRFVEQALKLQKEPFELVNVGLGRALAVKDLVAKIIQHSGKDLPIEFDTSKPSIDFNLAVDTTRAQQKFQWKPEIDLDEGIKRTLAWYEKWKPSS